MPKCFGQRCEVAQPLQPALHFQALSQSPLEPAPDIDVELAYILHDLPRREIREAQWHIEEPQQYDFQKDERSAQDESQRIVAHIDLGTLPYCLHLAAQLLQKLHGAMHLPTANLLLPSTRS